MRFPPLSNYMSSSSRSNFNVRGRGPWRRGYSDRPPPPQAQGYGGGSISGENYGDQRLGYINQRQVYNHQPPQGYRGNYPGPRGSHQQHQQQFRPRAADHRNWIFARPHPPPRSEKFTVVSYNILADYLARDHRHELYYHIPHHILDWESRKKRLLFEFNLWSPDVMCLQEVDRFQDLDEELAHHGYAGIWKMRTGKAVDGCAIFWRKNRFHLRHEEHIEFNKLGLRDNVAQFCLLESRTHLPAETSTRSLSASSDQSNGVNQVLICNIHVLYNPKRGEIKLGQVRALLDRAQAISKIWNDAPIVICGDFNCTPKSPLYNFISEQKLFLSGLARNEVSGQQTVNVYAPRPYVGYRGPQSAYGASGAQGFDAGSYFKETDDHYKSQKDMGNTPLSQQLSPSEDVTCTLVMSEKPISSSESRKDMLSCVAAKEVNKEICLDNTISTQYKLVDPSVNESGNKQSDSLLHTENTRTNEVSPCTAEVDQNQGRTNRPSDHFSERDVTSSKPSDVASILGRQHDTTSEKASSAEGYSENKTPVDSSASVDLLGMDSGTSSANIEMSTLDSMEILASLSREKISGNVIPDQNTCTILPVSSASDIALNDGDKVRIGDACVDKGSGTPYSDKKESLENRKQLEDHSDDMSCITTDDLCGNEISDINFLKEFHGTEDASEYTEEATPNSYQSQADLGMERPPYDPYFWTPSELEIATGDSERMYIEHTLKLRSVYTDVEDCAGTKDATREPQVTSYHRKFSGTVDYIWCSEGLQTVKVLDTIPKHVLQRTPGFPTHKWGSDHLALACQFAFTSNSKIIK